MSKKTKNFKIGIFGSSFNPLHLGHLNLLIQVQEKFKFGVIKVVPAWQNPLALSFLEPSPEKRLTIVRKVFKKYSFVEVDDQEVKRGGLSYTIDTINMLTKKHPDIKDMFLIIGIDQLVQFDKWKEFENIIKKVHLVVCSRKGYEWNNSAIPPSLRENVLSVRLKSFVNSVKTLPKPSVKLKTGKNVYWIPLNNMDISSSCVRQRNKQGLSINHLVPPLVDQWIQKKGLYQNSLSIGKTGFPSLMKFCVDILTDKKAEKIRTFDLQKIPSFPFDFVLIASGLNIRHTKVLASYLHRQVKKKFSFLAEQMEGQKSGEWIVLDYGELIVHIFYNYTREYYRLEDFYQEQVREKNK